MDVVRLCNLDTESMIMRSRELYHHKLLLLRADNSGVPSLLSGCHTINICKAQKLPLTYLCRSQEHHRWIMVRSHLPLLVLGPKPRNPREVRKKAKSVASYSAYQVQRCISILSPASDDRASVGHFESHRLCLKVSVNNVGEVITLEGHEAAPFVSSSGTFVQG